jgi:hypothetical protein
MIQPRPGLVLVRPKGSTNPADYQAMHESAIPAYPGVERVPDSELDEAPAERPSRSARKRAANDTTDEAAPAARSEASGRAAATTAQEG